MMLIDASYRRRVCLYSSRPSPLAAAMRRMRDARHCRRLQAVLLVAEGRQVGEAAAPLKASHSRVTTPLFKIVEVLVAGGCTSQRS